MLYEHSFILRYPGYYYDSETELYYLQSRYYDPTICRFINADIYVSTGQGLLGHNMFAYCLNNPVCRVEVCGAASEEIFDGDGNSATDDDKRFDWGEISNPSGKSSSKPGGSSGNANSNSGTNSSVRTEVHHIVEQCQANKSGFSQSQIQADSNKIELPYDVHRAISGYYSSIKHFSDNMRVRDWLAGQSFEFQTRFGHWVIEQIWK